MDVDESRLYSFLGTSGSEGEMSCRGLLSIELWLGFMYASFPLKAMISNCTTYDMNYCTIVLYFFGDF